MRDTVGERQIVSEPKMPKNIIYKVTKMEKNSNILSKQQGLLFINYSMSEPKHNAGEKTGKENK